MSQIRHKTLKSAATIAIMALMPIIVMPVGVTAEATTVNQGLRTQGLRTIVGQSVHYSAPLSALDTRTHAGLADTAIIDWRTPSQTLTFDSPDTQWTSDLSLTLSADPVGRTNAKAPIYVEFNGQAPIKINTRGRGFDARLSLDTSRLKPRHNKLRIYYEKPQNADCLSSDDGGWALNLSTSSLTIKGRQKTRGFKIQDVEARLSNPITAPALIGLLASGTDAATYQALLAQAIGQRMDTPPRFTTAKGYGDMEFVVGRRDAIQSFIRNKDRVKTSRANIFVDSGQSMRVILTGDTDDEVMSAARAFAQFNLPKGHTSEVALGHMALQPSLKRDVVLAEGRETKLSDLGSINFASNWNPDDRLLKFDVKDPNATQGEVLLRLNTQKTSVSPANTLSLNLNGQKLGQTTLDKTRKSVAFTIPDGLLRGRDNLLSIDANLDAESISACAGSHHADNAIAIGAGSTLKLTPSGHTPVTDLSRFTATGAPFSNENGADTVLVLPKRAAAYNDALRLLAKLSQTQGGAWTQAEIIRDPQNFDAKGWEAVAQNKNILFIAPPTDLPKSLTQTAPKSVKDALKGQALTGDNLLAAAHDKFASVSETSVLQMAAQKNQTHNRVQKGGIAALFESPYDQARLVGVITSTPGYSFRKSLNALQQTEHWSQAEGSVARWDSDTILMAALSAPLPNFVTARTPIITVSKFDTVKQQFESLNFQSFEMPKFDASNFALPEFSVPEISVDTQILKEFSAKLMFWRSETPATEARFVDDTLIQKPLDEESIAISQPNPASTEAAVTPQPTPIAPRHSFLDQALQTTPAKPATQAVIKTAPPLPAIRKNVPFKKSTSVKTTVKRSITDPRYNDDPKSFGYPQTESSDAIDAMAAPNAMNTPAIETIMPPPVAPSVTQQSTMENIGQSLQATLQPIGSFVKDKTHFVSSSASNATGWTEAKLSPSGLILILALLALLGSFGLSDPKRRKI